MVGGASGCCTNNIRASGNICELPSDTGCVMNTMTSSAPSDNNDDDSFCAAGFAFGDDVCCAASCGATCGSTGCGSLNGGAANCCASHIRASGNICQDPNDTVCVKEGAETTSTTPPEETPPDSSDNDSDDDGDDDDDVVESSTETEECLVGNGQIVEEVGLPPSLSDLFKLVGYRGDGMLPSINEGTDRCGISAAQMESVYGIIGNDGVDDTDGIQAAIDAIPELCPSRGYDALAYIELPSGVINTSREIHVDVSFLILRGQGSDPNNNNSSSQSTIITFEPDETTKYDNISDFDLGDMKGPGTSNGGWIWPGRGAFRVQTRAVHETYLEDYATAPDNRLDFFEGSVNFHWRSGILLAADAKFGDKSLQLETTLGLAVGMQISLLVANSHGMYNRQGVLPEDRISGHMRQQMFTVVAINNEDNTIVIDKPIEHDAFKNSTADGSSPICDAGSSEFSKVVPLDVVEGVGFENIYLQQVIPDLDPAAAKYNYNNLVREQAMHGFVFKWALNSYVRNVRTYMTGSHPIVTEVARNVQFENNWLEGSWNKGKGGNGYFRNSRVWDSLIQNNTALGLRHLTLQWSASGNIVRHNNLDSDLNLHGGWERNNLIEQNIVQTPFEHRECHPDCAEGDSTWWPIWVGAGMHAGSWSGSTGPRNIFFNNKLQKQQTSGGAFADYMSYGQEPTTVFQFFWNTDNNGEGSHWKHLSSGDGVDLETWSLQENVDYSPGNGVNDLCSFSGESLLGATVACTTDRNPEPTLMSDADPMPLMSDPEPMPLMSSARGGSFLAIQLFCIVGSFLISLSNW